MDNAQNMRFQSSNSIFSSTGLKTCIFCWYFLVLLIHLYFAEDWKTTITSQVTAWMPGLQCELTPLLAFCFSKLSVHSGKLKGEIETTILVSLMSRELSFYNSSRGRDLLSMSPTHPVSFGFETSSYVLGFAFVKNTKASGIKLSGFN